MRILIANDDGIESPGIIELARIAKELGEVYVVAPMGQQSAMSHRVTVHGGLSFRREEAFPVEGVQAVAVSGSPADCVKAGINSILGFKPDLLLSGINQGYNAGYDAIYSGTVGAAMEGLLNGVPSIAFSVEHLRDMRACGAYLPGIMMELLKKDIESYEIWNINVPSLAPEDIRGVLYDRRISKKQYYQCSYIKELDGEDEGRLSFHFDLATEDEEGTDIDALLRGYISVGRLTEGMIRASRHF